MGIKTFISRMLGLDRQSVEVNMKEFLGETGEAHVRELAFWSCVNLIASAISKCEFKTYTQGKEIKGGEYYSWNFAPNTNQSSSVFLHKLISKLYWENEALVVSTDDGQRLVADSYIRKEYAIYDDIFEQVTVGDYTFKKTFAQSEILYFKLHNQDMRRVVNSLYQSYQNLLNYGMKAYQQSRGKRGILNIATMEANKLGFREEFEKLMNERFKTFFTSENAVLPLFDGYSYTELGTSKAYQNEGTRDIRAMIDDISDFTAKAFSVPPALLSGEVQGTSDALDQFLTFCIDPLADMLSEEINRKIYGKEVLTGNYMQIDTKCIKHVDLLSVSTAIDKLIASGAFCVNDIRKIVGDAPIDEPWASQHFMTKNYATVQDLLEALNAEVVNE